MKLHAIPCFSASYAADGGNRDAEGRRELLCAANCGADFRNLRQGQLHFAGRIPQLLTFRLSPLLVSICRIFRMRSKKEVIDIDTGPVVAGVAHNLTVWNGTINCNPGQPVNSPALSLPKHHSVAGLCATRGPDATSGRVGARVKGKALTKIEVARHAFLSQLWHSLIRSLLAIGGQGRDRRYSAARPAPTSIKRVFSEASRAGVVA